MLSTTEHLASSEMLRTAYRVSAQPQPMSIATVIKEARTRKGWSQRELANRMKVKAGAVGQWETAATKPTIPNRVDLSKLLDIPFIRLMPEIAGSGELAMNDRELLAIVQQLIELPPPVRQALLMGVSATAEHLRSQDRSK